MLALGSKPCLVISVSDADKLDINIDMMVSQGELVVTVTNPAVGDTVREDRVRFMTTCIQHYRDGVILRTCYRTGIFV